MEKKVTLYKKVGANVKGVGNYIRNTRQISYTFVTSPDWN